jgi:inhibitor of cysteine peptidase
VAQFNLDDSQNGTRLNLRVGDVVVVRLAENPSTGYRWEIVAAAGLNLEADDFHLAPAGATGQGGQRALRFKAAAVGLTGIEAVLRRNWEGAAPSQRFSVAVEVG